MVAQQSWMRNFIFESDPAEKQLDKPHASFLRFHLPAPWISHSKMRQYWPLAKGSSFERWPARALRDARTGLKLGTGGCFSGTNASQSGLRFATLRAAAVLQ